MCCFGAEYRALQEQKRQNEIIDAQLMRDKDVYKATHRFLLLGTSESGKTTIMKQMKILNKDGFSDAEREEIIKNVRITVKDVILTVTQGMSEIDPPVEFANPKNRERYDYLLEHATKLDFDYPPEFFEICNELWKDEGVIACFQRSNEFQLMENAAHFMDEDKLKEIATPSYKPSDQDFLWCRVTSGIFEIRILVDRVHFHMYEVVGQRIERKKWIRCFNDVTAIIFVVDCSSFDMVIREDGKTNQLRESLELFESIWNNRRLRTVSIILFLNKQDILKEKVEVYGQNVADYFPEFSSYRPPQDAFDQREPGDSDTYILAKHFFKDQFLREFISAIFRDSNKELARLVMILRLSQTTYDGRHYCYPHFTTAIDTENIRRLFGSSRDIIQRTHLHRYEKL